MSDAETGAAGMGAAERSTRPRPLRLRDAGVREVRFEVTCDCAAREALLGAGVSKAEAGRILARGSLTRAGEPVREGARLAAGDEVRLELARTAGRGSARPGRASAPASVICHDRFFVAVDKPAGLIVHGDGSGCETLTDRVQAWADGRGLGCSVQALQRLDADTTGVVLFSLTEEFQGGFDALVAGHDMRKRYLLEVAAGFPEGERRIERPIGRDRHDARRMRVSASGKAAATRVRKLGEANGRSLLLAELETGRRHQIRVHLASMGFPLAGDALYGGPRADGLMLHALEEALLHPVTGERLTVRAPWPKRFERDFSARDYPQLRHT